jgi:hypothetical protein
MEIKNNMKKYQQAIASVAFLTLFLSAGLNFGLPDADAYDDNIRSKDKSGLILDSFENGDYKLWKTTIGKGAISELITNNDFQHFLAARSAIRAGNYDQAIALTEGLEAKLKTNIGEIYLS